MTKLRKVLLNVIPCMVWTMIASIAYGVLAYEINRAVDDSGAYFVERYFVEGMLLAVPLVCFSKIVKVTKNIIQFVLLSVLLVCLSDLLLGSVAFTVAVIILGLFRLVSRLQNEFSVFDSTNEFSLLLYPLYFVVTAFSDNAFMQNVTVYYFLLSSVLIFVYSGLERFDHYIFINQTKAYVPTATILNTGAKIFVIVGMSIIFICMPVIRNNFEYVSLELPQFEKEITLATQDEENVVNAEKTESNNSLEALFSEREENPYFAKIADFMERFMMYLIYPIIATFCLFACYKIVKNFNNVVYTKDDVIESTFAQKDAVVSELKAKFKDENIFNFSKEMKIRRKYKKEFKKFKPENWQTPTEIEIMSNKNISTLHDLYEDARYNKH